MNNNRDRVPIAHYRAKFAALDAEEISVRSGVPFDKNHGLFSLKILNHSLTVQWPEFYWAPEHPTICPSILSSAALQILVLRYLTGGACVPPAGKFLSFRELPWGEVYDRNFQGRCVKRLAFGFGARLQDFSKAAERLGGIRLEAGDRGYELPFFPWLKIRLILRAGDDELPPTSQFLFSDNTALAFSAEDLAVVGDIVIGALKEEARRI